MYKVAPILDRNHFRKTNLWHLLIELTHQGRISASVIATISSARCLHETIVLEVIILVLTCKQTLSASSDHLTWRFRVESALIGVGACEDAAQPHLQTSSTPIVPHHEHRGG